jgi:hypothetical protein
VRFAMCDIAAAADVADRTPQPSLGSAAEHATLPGPGRSASAMSGVEGLAPWRVHVAGRTSSLRSIEVLRAVHALGVGQPVDLVQAANGEIGPGLVRENNISHPLQH